MQILTVLAIFAGPAVLAIGIERLGEWNFRRWKKNLGVKTDAIVVCLRLSSASAIASQISDEQKRGEAMATIDAQWQKWYPLTKQK